MVPSARLGLISRDHHVFVQAEMGLMSGRGQGGLEFVENGH